MEYNLQKKKKKESLSYTPETNAIYCKSTILQVLKKGCDND